MNTATVAATLGVTEPEYASVENLAYEDATYDWANTDSEGRWRLRSTAEGLRAAPPRALYGQAYAHVILLLAGE